MDLIKEKERLITKLEQYLKEECSHEKISNHAWTIIEYFSKKDSSELPERTDFESEFWYTIWQIQHPAIWSMKLFTTLVDHSMNVVGSYAVVVVINFIKRGN